MLSTCACCIGRRSTQKLGSVKTTMILLCLLFMSTIPVIFYNQPININCQITINLVSAF